MIVSRLARGLLGSTALFTGFLILTSGTGTADDKDAAKPAPPVAAPLPKGAGGKAAIPGPPPAPADGEYTEGITLATDRKVKELLEAAQDDVIQNEAWSEAAPLLQRILDKKEDVFVPVKRKSAAGSERVYQVSARAQANHLLEGMPSNGRAFYELRYGQQAKALLVKAKEEGGIQGLREITRRFYYTDAGLEAMELLGTYYLDRGRPYDAALCFKRLLERTGRGAQGVAPLSLFKATYAFRRVGDPAYRRLADETWKTLLARLGREGLRQGNEVFKLEQLQQELDRTVPMDNTSPTEWAMFRGDVTRTAQGRGSAPFLEGKWRNSSVDEGVDPLTTQFVGTALKNPPKAEAMMAAFFPIATRGKIIYRNYKSITAVDAKTGDLFWRSDCVAALDKLLHDSQKKPAVQDWYQNFHVRATSPTVLFDNSMIGTLSTDNVRVYAVDDLGIPPSPGVQNGGWPGGFNGGGQAIPASPDLVALMQHNRLVAIEIDSGKILWELGDPARDYSPLAGSFFLGPPLPMAGQLFVLTEKNSELRLVCLDAAKGDLIWAQTLATAREKLINDVSRRIHAVHLAYAEGVLVCPTNAGAVLGFDIWSNSLVWAYPYREKQEAPPAGRPMPGRRGAIMMDGSVRMGAGLAGEWKMTAPLIHDGKVIFTAPDGGAIHCLNLKDGEPLWQAERKDDVYVACIYDGKVVLVGKNTCRALSLADGKTKLWEVETGMPSGQGVASGSFYYLPLRKGEVCKIDMEKGLVAAHSPSPKNETPGNLLFYEGDVISQTESALSAYPQVDFKVAQIDASLKRNPKDPAALTERGELRLFKGDLAGAVADLRTAIANSAPAAVLPKTRAKLYATLTELFQRDFTAAEQYLEEYKELCKIPIQADATAEQKRAAQQEQTNRQAGFLILLARGREQQGRLVEAFQAYLDFTSLAANQDQIPVINEPSVKVQPGLWAQGRIAQLVAKASPAQRRPLEAEIASRWQKIKSSEKIEDLQRFVVAFGSQFAAGREARLFLAERLTKENRLLEAELHLLQLRSQQDDRSMAARAAEALAQLMTRRGLLDEAVAYYRILGSEFARVVVRDGKNGAELFKELSADKRYLPYLGDVEDSVFGVPLRVEEIPGTTYPTSNFQSYEFKGATNLFTEKHRLVWMSNNNGMSGVEIKLVDQNTGEDRWSMKTAPMRIGQQRISNLPGRQLRLPCFITGHLGVFYAGHTVVALNLVDRKKLWEYDLLSPLRTPLDNQAMNATMLELGPDLSLQVMNADSTVETLGLIGAVTPSFVCLRTQDGLMALDPATGNTLWTRNDVSRRTSIFADEDLLYLIEPRGDSSGGPTRAIRGRDGTTVSVPDFGHAYRAPHRTLGGRILLSENDPTGALVLRLYDIRLGKDTWKKTLPFKTILLQTEDPELLAYLDPKGTVTAVDLRLRQEIFQSVVAEGHMEKVNSGLFLEDAHQFYLTLSRPPEQPALPGQAAFAGAGAVSNLMFMRAEPVNGTVYAFEKPTGKVNWYLQVPTQMLLMEQFRVMPMMIFSARVSSPAQGVPNRFINEASTLSVDKRTGKRLYDKRTGRTGSSFGVTPFQSLVIDRRAGTFDLVASNFRLRHIIEDQPEKRLPDDTRAPERSISAPIERLAFERRPIKPNPGMIRIGPDSP